MNIRSATHADAETIASFNTLLASETEDVHLDPATILAGVRAGLADAAKAHYFVAEEGGHVVGQIMITHEWSDWRNGDIWWIQSVYVDQAHRRHGVFRGLYEFVCERASDAGAIGIRLYVDTHNSAAQETYAALGMHVTDYKLMEVMFDLSSADD
jgi:GNAT superfamily N-acetyltransferase